MRRGASTERAGRGAGPPFVIASRRRSNPWPGRRALGPWIAAAAAPPRNDDGRGVRPARREAIASRRSSPCQPEPAGRLRRTASARPAGGGRYSRPPGGLWPCPERCASGHAIPPSAPAPAGRAGRGGAPLTRPGGVCPATSPRHPRGGAPAAAIHRPARIAAPAARDDGGTRAPALTSQTGAAL